MTTARKGGERREGRGAKLTFAVMNTVYKKKKKHARLSFVIESF
jgi:hypothetical protein